MWQLRKLQKSGAVVALSSDYDVGPLSPLGHVGRALQLGARSLPTAADALRAVTIEGAKIMGNDDDVDTLEVGKLADFVVLDRDVLAASPADIIQTNVVLTAVGGEVVWKSSAF